MTRIKHNYRNDRLNDSSWGLNLENSPNDIEDKQWTKLLNWNFEWNKLIASKDELEVYDEGWTTEVSWLLIDWTDVWYIHNQIIYKNWVNQITSWTLPDKRWNMTFWADILIMTAEDGTQGVWTLEAWAVAVKSTTFTGLPRYNTVYNWKLILGWYDITPNSVLHSKTASITDTSLLFDFSAYNSWSALVWDWSAVTWFSVGENWLYVFKEREVWYSNSEKDTTTTFDLIYNKITSNGNLNQHTITEVEQETFYFDFKNKSVRRLGYEVNLTTLRDSAISKEIEPIFSELSDNQDYATTSYAYPNYKLFLRSKLAGANTNDVCLTYNVDRKSWLVEDLKDCSVSHKGYFGSSYEWKIFKDDAQVKEWQWEAISKHFDYWDWVDNKRFVELELIGKMSSTMTLYVDIYVDWNLKTTKTINVDEKIGSTLWTNVLWASVLWSWKITDDITFFRRRFDFFYEWQHYEYWLRYDWIGRVEISDRNSQYKFIKAYKIY